MSFTYTFEITDELESLYNEMRINQEVDVKTFLDEMINNKFSNFLTKKKTNSISSITTKVQSLPDDKLSEVSSFVDSKVEEVQLKKEPEVIVEELKAE